MKSYALPILFSSLLCLVGCTQRIVNLTPEQLPQNPSGIYTISAATDFQNEAVVPGTLRMDIVIDGKRHQMQPSSVGDGIWDFTYTIPETRDTAAYYFVAYYDSFVSDSVVSRTTQSDIFRFKLANRYVISMESERGPVGTRIPVVGRGFTEFDRIYIGGIEAETTYGTPNAISFVVPPLEANKSYQVEIDGADGRLPIGVFRVDPVRMQVSPATLRVPVGQRGYFVVGIPAPAPRGGLVVTALTDIPEVLVMPEIVIPQGSRTVSVPYEGRTPARGVLHLRAPGFEDVEVSVVVE